MKEDLIDILLPTYNGSKYIRILLDSLIDQTHQNWHLYIRDDHSKDNTVEIIKEYVNQNPKRITLLDDDLGNLGVDKNFATLLAISKSNYTCFCDQDDKWMSDKLEVSLKAIKNLEHKTPDKPCMVFSNLCMVDSELNVIAESRWIKDKIKPHYNSLNKVIMQSHANGCTMIMNKQLVELANPIPNDAVWFDHWISLVGAAAGKLDFIDRTTIFYRIHDNNASRGENRVTKTKDEDQLSKKLNNENFKAYFGKLQQQALAVKHRMEERGYQNPKSLKVLEDFVTIKEKNAINRRLVMIKNGFFKHTWPSTLKWLARI